jgi:hypothetical protein
MPSRTDYQKDLELLKDFLRGQSSDQVKLEVLQYFKLAKTYFIPKRGFQDLALHADRICDLIAGVPYTSQKNVWPVDVDTKEHLQLLLQLRLEKAGRLLRRDVGKGLLQVFGYSTDVYGYLRFQHRVIDPDDLRQPATTVNPEKMAKSIAFGEKIQNSPKIFWRSAGSMLMGNFSYLKLDFEQNPVADIEEYAADDGSAVDITSRLIAFNESYEILDHVRSTPYFGTYLGGYGGSNGSLANFLNIDPAEGSLLIRTGSDEDDAHIGVSVRFNKDGKIIYDVDGCYL